MTSSDSLKPTSVHTPRHSPTASVSVDRASTEPRAFDSLLPRSSSPSTPQSLVFSLSPSPRLATPSARPDNTSGDSKAQCFAWPTDSSGGRISPIAGNEKRPQRVRTGSLIPAEHEHERERHMSTSSQFTRTTAAPDLSLSINSPRDRPSHLVTDSPTRFNLQVCLSPSIMSLAQYTTPCPAAPSSPFCSSGTSEAPFFQASRNTSTNYCSPLHPRQLDRSGIQSNTLTLFCILIPLLTFSATYALLKSRQFMRLEK